MKKPILHQINYDSLILLIHHLYPLMIYPNSIADFSVARETLNFLMTSSCDA